MKNTLFLGITMFVGSFLMAQSDRNPTAANLPYSYGFETADLDEWFVTNDGAGNVWERTQASTSTPDPSEGIYYMNYSFHPSDPANTYLYSKGLNLEAGKDITLQFDYQGVASFFPEKLEVRIGTEATVAGQTTQLWVNEAIENYPYETATVNFTVPADGVYYLSFRAFSDPDQFYLSLDNIKVFESALATESFVKSTLKFYPNPVQDILNIADSKQITSVEIYDISGKRVLSQNAKSNSLQVNVSNLKAGAYIVKVVSEGLGKNFKIIKK